MPAKYIPSSQASPDDLERRRARQREIQRRWRENNPEANAASQRAQNDAISEARRLRRASADWQDMRRGKTVTILGEILTEARRSSGINYDDLTVLAPFNDPYRIDAPAFQTVGEWVAKHVASLVPEGRFHIRGLVNRKGVASQRLLRRVILDAVTVGQNHDLVPVGVNRIGLQDTIHALCRRTQGHLAYPALAKPPALAGGPLPSKLRLRNFKANLVTMELGLPEPRPEHLRRGMFQLAAVFLT
jgi:hypothetical protein